MTSQYFILGDINQLLLFVDGNEALQDKTQSWFDTICHGNSSKSQDSNQLATYPYIILLSITSKLHLIISAMSNEADSSDDGDIRNDRSSSMQIQLFSFIHHVYITIFLNIANGADELAGVDTMESEEVHGLALAATSKNGKHDCK